jgi:copper(I)-binding protein
MRYLLVIAALLLPAAASAEGVGVSDAWSRATVTTAAPGVAYLTITDTGAADSVTGVSTPIAASASLHQSTTEGGVMRMTPVPALPIAAGGTVTLAPGGYHIMLEGLTQALKAGDQFPLTLTFEHAGPITTMVTVKPLGTAAKSMMDDMSHHH